MSTPLLNILLITEKNHFLTTSLKIHLQKNSYQVFVTPPDTDAINAITDEISGILIYADAHLRRNKQQQALAFIKDRAIANNTPCFILGDPTEAIVIKSIIPAPLICREFYRPINVKETLFIINDIIRHHQQLLCKKILLVDDSGIMLRNLKNMLEHKYAVSVANSGAMAIRNLTLSRPDLILLDYEMPVVDGKQLLQMLRTEMEFSDIPVIFLTVKSDRESILGVKDLKPEGYLLKSLEPAELLQAIDDFFEKQYAGTNIFKINQ